jgi:hypothetical protein
MSFLAQNGSVRLVFKSNMNFISTFEDDYISNAPTLYEKGRILRLHGAESFLRS